MRIPKHPYPQIQEKKKVAKKQKCLTNVVLEEVIILNSIVEILKYKLVIDLSKVRNKQAIH